MMKTVAPAKPIRWIVEVTDVRDTAKSWPGYSARFVFEGEDAAMRAFVCREHAEEAGFVATAERMKKV